MVKKSKISTPAGERCYGDLLDVSVPTAAKSRLKAVVLDKENIDPILQSGESSGNDNLSSDSGGEED